MTVAIAIVTCAELPDLDPDDRAVIEPLAALGISAEPAVWDDPAVDWDRFDLAVLRSPWDYTPRRNEFVAWARSVPRLANDAETVVWNTDKRYLAELVDSGVDVVPTTWIAPGTSWTVPAIGEWVLKPAISAGSRDTGRYDLSLPEHRTLAADHVQRLSTTGQVTMAQPYLDAVDTQGETALIFIDGTFSHAIRKGPLLDGPDTGMSTLYKPETITARTPSAAEHALAARVLKSLPGQFPPPLYARVDLVPGPDGQPVLIELELTEPSLFFGYGSGSARRFADAIARLLAE